MAQKYEWGWESFFINGGEPYEQGEGYTSKAAALADVKKAREEESASLETGFQNEDTLVEYKLRRRPVFVKPEWEAVAG